MINKILNVLNSVLEKKNPLIFILAGAVVFLIMTNLNTCRSKSESERLAEQNAEAMKKEIRVEKNKNGELQSSIVAFEGKSKDLGKYSEDLKKEVDALKNRKPQVIIKTQVMYIGDSANVPNSLTDNGNGIYDLNWSYSNEDSTRVLGGKSSFSATVDLNKADFSYKLNVKPGTTQISTDILRLDFVVGVAKNKKTGFDEIFVTPKNTNVTVGKLEGAILDKKRDKRFSAGPIVGYGITYNGNGIGTGPFIGIGIGYSFIKF
jgi:hypothetical protein